MGALALDHLLVMGDQGVQLERKGSELGRIVALHPLGAAAADGDHLAPQVEQGFQPDPDLQGHHRHEAGAQQHQEDRRADREALDVPVDGAAVGGGHEHQGWLVARQAPRQGHGPQRLLQRAAGVVTDRGGHRQARQVGRSRQLGVPQRAGAGHGRQPAAGNRGDLPIASGIDPERAGVGERRGDDLA